MLSFLHKIVSFPAVYDFAQRIAGAAVTQQVLREEFARLTARANALDIGGGTGLLRPLVPPAWEYTCLDIDPQKLEGFQRKYPRDSAVLSSATTLPFPDASFDVAILCAVSHHLTETELDLTLSEAFRVLKRGGHLLFLDALRMPHRLRSRLLWAVDRGSNPRSFEELRVAVDRNFHVQRELRYQVHHAYVCWTLLKPASPQFGFPSP